MVVLAFAAWIATRAHGHAGFAGVLGSCRGRSGNRNRRPYRSVPRRPGGDRCDRHLRSRGVHSQLRLRILAAGSFSAVCALLAFPVLLAYAGTNNIWHVTVLGLMAPFDGLLAIASPFYSLGHFYNDTYANAIISSYANSRPTGVKSVTLGSKGYTVASRPYWLQVVLTFPADVLFRTYASALEVINLPFRTQVPEFLHDSGLLRFYAVRAGMLGPLWGAGAALALAMIVILALSSFRVMTWWSFALLYFLGTPALQFEARHYFHLEVIGWLVLGFLLRADFTDAPALGHAPAVVD